MAIKQLYLKICALKKYLTSLIQKAEKQNLKLKRLSLF